MNGNSAVAKDITQETFVKLYYHLDSNLRLDNPKAWLYRVAANMSYNHSKRKKIYNRIIQGHETQNNPINNPENEIYDKEDKQLLRIAIEKLPMRDRTILQLYQDDLSYAEIAQVMGIKVSSVGKILSRAIQKCSNLIER